MKIAFWYEVRIRNDGPPLYLKDNAARFKEEYDIDTVKHYIPLEDKIDRYGDFDLNIWVDFGDDALTESYGIKYGQIRSPSAYWVSDSHVGLDYRIKKAKEFDYVFVAISSHVPIFKKALGHNKVYWLPHAGEPTVYHKDFVYLSEHLTKNAFYYGRDYGYWRQHPEKLMEKMNRQSLKKYDVCFIGHLNSEHRIDALDTLFKEFPNFFYSGGGLFFEKAARKYMDSKLVFNISIGKEANMRAFEVPLTGSALLTDEVDDLKKMGFKDGENVIFYNTMEEAVEKAKYYLEHEDEREEIARKGQELVLNNHTYKHRLETILKTTKIIKK